MNINTELTCTNEEHQSQFNQTTIIFKIQVQNLILEKKVQPKRQKILLFTASQTLNEPTRIFIVLHQLKRMNKKQTKPYDDITIAHDILTL